MEENKSDQDDQNYVYIPSPTIDPQYSQASNQEEDLIQSDKEYDEDPKSASISSQTTDENFLDLVELNAEGEEMVVNDEANLEYSIGMILSTL